MPPALFVTFLLQQLAPCPAPSRCPYCPVGTPPHWIRWGHYERYAGDPEQGTQKVAIPRYRCKIVVRTFSLLPDALLPYCSVRSGRVLAWLQALYVDATPLSRLAHRVEMARGTLRGLRVRFQRALPQLRLPGQPAAWPPARFLEALRALDASAIVVLFRVWKEREPKHSVVGLHPR